MYGTDIPETDAGLATTDPDGTHPSGIAMCLLSPDGIITSWNAAAARLRRLESSEVIGRHFELFFTEADRAAGLPQKLLAHVIETGTHLVEGWRRRGDGEVFWARTFVNALRDADGRVTGLVHVTEDLTAARA